MNATLTIDDVRRAIDSVEPLRPTWLDHFGSFGGIKFYDVEPNIVPKIQLSPACPVSDEFRVEMNSWLLETFGARDETPMKRGTMLMASGLGLFVRRDDRAMLMSHAT